MTDQASLFAEPKPAKISLREQAECARRELAMRRHVYPGLVARGKMTEADAARETSTMQAIEATLSMFSEFEADIREALRAALSRKRELASVRGHPAVEAVFDAFPGAEIVDVRDISEEAA